MRRYMILAHLLSSVFLFSTLTVSAQQDSRKKDEIREKAYNTINKGYDTYATVNGEEALLEFLRLFIDEDVPVYNDLLGITSKRKLSAGDYARLLNDDQITTKRVHIKNLQMVSEPTKLESGWKVVVEFDKEMSYYNNCGVYFSSRDFYGADYHLTATLIYDEMDGQCRITSIDGTIDSSNILPIDYVVMKQSSKQDLQLNYHQQPICFNSSMQAILPGMFDSKGFSHPKFEANRLSPSIDNCNIVTMHYLSADDKWRIKPHIGIGLGDALSVDGDSTVLGKSSSAFSFGVDAGYMFMKSDPLRLSLFFGLALSTSSLDLSYSADSYTTQFGADADGETYTRYYDKPVLSQTLKFTDLSVPLYLDAEIGLGSEFSIYADLGLRFNFNMSSKISETSGQSGPIYGTFTPQNIKLDEKWGFDGFSAKQDFSSAETVELTGKKGMSADLLAGLGIRYSIPNTPLAVNIGVNYLMGLGKVLEPEKTKDQPIIYNTLSEDKSTSTEHVNLPGQIESVKRKSLQLSIGISYNL